MFCVSCIKKDLATQERQASVSAHARFERGLGFVADRDWDKAITEFDAMIELDPKDATAYECRGCARFMKGDSDKAIADLSRAIQVNPTNPSAYFNRAGVYCAKENFRMALEDFDACLQLAPSNHQAFKYRAAVHSSIGSDDKAIADWNEYLRFESKDARSFYARGFAHFRLRQFNKALEDYRESLRLAPKQPDVLNQIAWIQAVCPVDATRNGREAIVVATEACELTGWHSSQFIDTLAAAFAEGGDFASAVKYQRRAIELGDTNEVVVGQMKERLLLFETSQPFREAKNATSSN